MANQVIAVWSAPGSVGRSQLAAAFAVELASAQQKVLLIDADVVAPSQLQLFGFAENHIGLASACRLADRGELTEAALNSMLLEYEMPKAKLNLMPGLHLVSRWPELGFEPMLQFIEYASQLFDYVVIDTSPSLERELIDQRSLAERNAVTHAALTAADQIVGVCSGDPIGLARYIWAVQELKQLHHGGKLLTLLNRISPALGRSGVSDLEQTLHRLAAITTSGQIPLDVALFERSISQSLPVNLVAKNSSAKQAIAAFIRGQIMGLDRSPRRLAKLG